MRLTGQNSAYHASPPYNGGLILTLTVNPAIDRTISVDRLAFEDRAYINSRHDSAGGRGINAACVIHSFGGKPVAIFPSGGRNGKRLEEFLATHGYPTIAVPIRHEIRTNLTITDRQGLTVNLNETRPATWIKRKSTVWKRRCKRTWTAPPGCCCAAACRRECRRISMRV